jgi:hypothetical protein
VNSAAKLTPRFDSAELGSVLPSPFLLDRIAKVSSQIQFCRDSLGFTLACLFELTREVFLPDQSGRIVRARRKVGKSYLEKTLWKFVDACAKQLAGKSSVKSSCEHRDQVGVGVAALRLNRISRRPDQAINRL